MGTRRYGISLRVEQEKRNSVSTSNHVLFCLSYKHNSSLIRKKPIWFMNENKWIENSRIIIVGADS